jgi:hypothetical protein
MNSSFQLQAVIESPYFPEEFVCPWEISAGAELSPIRLSGEMTYPEIGLVFAQLVQYNQIDFLGDRQTILNQLIAAENLILPGGIQAVLGDQIIAPSCCCGLETWREWQVFLAEGETPWLGHDPSPWLEVVAGDRIRIWSDGGLGESVKNAFHIEVERSVFRSALQGVESELQAFLVCVASWAQTLGLKQTEALTKKFDACFQIGRKFTVIPE